MNAEAQDARLFPPMAPDGERVVPDNPAFVAGCLTKLRARLTRYKLGTQLVSESDRWGTVLRIDFEIPDLDADHHVNRIICWQGSDGQFGVMLTIGQSVPPLQPP
jgi:hypothetical protein